MTLDSSFTYRYPLALFLFLWMQLLDSSLSEPLIESERRLEYKRRGYRWPLKEYVPNTTGWRQLMEERFRQVREIPDSNKRYEAFYQTMNSALVAPNFTEHGFGLGRAPEELTKELQNNIFVGLLKSGVEPMDSGVINTPNGKEPPILVRNSTLTEKVLHELLPYAEAWSGMRLVPYQAYGFRVYRNESQLLMHVDRLQTHVISFIYHIWSSDDAEPWPIFIEDFHGRTHEVTLTPGDMLFYESSKCFHGRPRRLNGSYYTSVFVHYYPHDWQAVDHCLEAHYAVPALWTVNLRRNTSHPSRLEMVETSMKQPDCPDDWCGVVDTVKWNGPGEEGYVITPMLEKIPFYPQTSLTDEL